MATETCWKAGCPLPFDPAWGDAYCPEHSRELKPPEPLPPIPRRRKAASATAPKSKNNGSGEPDPSSDPSRYFDRDGFIPALLGREVQTQGHLRVGRDGRLWRYEGGRYAPDGDHFARNLVRQVLGNRYRKRHADEVMAWCLAEFPTIPETPNPNIINCTNGLLDWATGEIRPHTPDEPSIIQIPVAYDPAAKCPAIDRFLADVLPADAVDLAIEVIAYCLLPRQPFRKAIMLLGRGGNGKSVLLALLRAFLGAENTVALPLQQLGESRFAGAELYGKLANICADLDPRALRRSDMFKAIVGGTDAVMAERKYHAPFTFVPFATMLFSANEPPPSSDQSDAFFDRWLILPFERRFDDGQADPHLLAKLTTRDELSGLLRRALAALPILMSRGHFATPESVRTAGRSYRERIDTVCSFIEDCLVVDANAKSERPRLYREYRDWCQTNGRLPISQQVFLPRLRSELPSIEERKSGTWYVHGVGLKAVRT